jgi:hypothetical protein
MLSFYALLTGIFFIGLAVRIRGLVGRADPTPVSPTDVI